MSQVIMTNVASLNSQRQLNKSQSALNQSLERLSSGLRINSAKDDAAGMAISSRMTSQVNGLNQAVRNANDGISMAQTAEGGLDTATGLLQRMRELAVQASNGSNSASDRASIQSEVSQLQQELTRVAQSTQFNGSNLLDGTLNNAQFQIGANANQTINMTIGNAQGTAIGNNTIALKDNVGTMVNALASANADTIEANNVAAQTLTIQGNGQSSGALDVDAGSSAKAIADIVNAASGKTGVTASATTTAVLSSFTHTGVVSFTVQGAPKSDGSANPITITAQVNDSKDMTALTTAFNNQTGLTGITAVADLSTGEITLTQAQGYDISIMNNSAAGAGSTGVKVTGAPTTSGGTGTAVTLTATAVDGNAATVGGAVSFNSASAFTATGSAAGILKTTAATSSTLNSVASIDVSTVSAAGTPTGANDALQVLDSALANVNASRAALGAMQNRFTSTISNLQSSSENLSAARSRIQDADFAAETAAMSKANILQQAGTAMLAQANSAPQNVLSLLK